MVMPDVPLGTSPVELPDPLLEPASDRPPHPETFADRLADLAELLHGERLPYAAPRIFQESAAPGPRVESARGEGAGILDVTFHEDVTLDETPARAMLAPPPSLLLLAEPQPPSIAPEIPIGAFDPRPAEHAVRSQEALEAELSGGRVSGPASGTSESRRRTGIGATRGLSGNCRSPDASSGIRTSAPVACGQGACPR